eukprot:3667638-Rhodomonas_salina.1
MVIPGGRQPPPYQVPPPPLIIPRLAYAVSGTDVERSTRKAIMHRGGTMHFFSYGAAKAWDLVPRICYAMSGTDVGYAPTRHSQEQ